MGNPVSFGQCYKLLRQNSAVCPASQCDTQPNPDRMPYNDITVTFPGDTSQIGLITCVRPCPILALSCMIAKLGRKHWWCSLSLISSYAVCSFNRPKAANTCA